LAGVLVNRVVTFMPHTADLARAEKPIDHALAASPRCFWARYAKGTVLRAQSR
jgi:hypothetical protein